MLAEPGTVYASKDTLYVATNHWWWWPEIGQTDATYVHAFDLRDPDRAPYVGSGTVDGTVRDQYRWTNSRARSAWPPTSPPASRTARPGAR